MIAEFNAFKALLNVTGVTANGSFPVLDQSDAVLQTSPKPTRYLCIYDQTPLQRKARLTGPYASEGFTFAVMHVGQTANEVRAAVERTRAALERQRLLGKTTPLRLIDNGPIHRDEEALSPRLFTALDVWRCAASTH